MKNRLIDQEADVHIVIKGDYYERDESKRPDIRLANFISPDRNKFSKKVTVKDLDSLLKNPYYQPGDAYRELILCRPYIDVRKASKRTIDSVINIPDFINAIAEEYEDNSLSKESGLEDYEYNSIQLPPGSPPIRDRYLDIPKYEYDNSLSKEENAELEVEYIEEMKAEIDNDDIGRYTVPKYYYMSPFDINRNILLILSKFGWYFKFDFDNLYERMMVLKCLEESDAIDVNS
jgi:hypothetical protein